MNKRILPLFCLALIFFGLLCPVDVHAAIALDPNAEAELTLHYQKDGFAFPDLQIQIYRVAEAFPDGSFALIAPFSSYPINIHDITQQSQWVDIVTTLCAYITAEQLAPDWETVTDPDGTASFQALKTGLYLVREAVGENNSGTYFFNAFMVYLPTPQPDGSYAYQVEARPKCTNYTPKTQYTVTKLWKDSGNQSARPKEITVDIYRDRVLQESQVLNAQNDWTYTWYVSGEDQAVWSVAEREVPGEYKVTIRENGGVFSLINTRNPGPEVPPQTGDTFAPLPWILAMCISGILLLILGLHIRRRK